MELDIYWSVLATVPSMELAIYWSVLSTVPNMELDIYWPVLSIVTSMELDIYWPVLATVPSMELAIYWLVLSTVSSMELDIFRPVLSTVPSMELAIYCLVVATVPSIRLTIYWPVLSTVPSMDLAIYLSVLSTFPTKYILKHILYSNGFGYVWERQSVVNERKFINSLVQRLKDQHIQQWFASIHRNSKLDAYIGFKTVYEHESYLHCVTIRKFRRILAQFRVSAHSLEIERGRYSGVARTDRICKIYQSSIEDQYHFVFICDIYKDLRVKYLPREYIISPSVFKFNKLFSDSNEQIQTKLALFLYHAMERRINYIDSLKDNQHQ